MITQAAVDMLAQSVAQQVRIETGIDCGYGAKIDTIGRRVIFVFRVLAVSSVQEVTIADLTRAHSWQAIYEALLAKAIEETSPEVHAKRMAARAAMDRAWGSHPPEIAPAIDATGRRHHRLFAEGGRYIFPKGD